jgi:hypothetical protein
VDPVERETAARTQYDLAVNLAQSDAWEQLSDALTAQIKDSLNDLARSSRDDEQNRGLIRALTHVLEMPENLIRAASQEIDKGTP